MRPVAAGRMPAHVSEHRLRRDDTAQAVEQRVPDGGQRAARDVRRAVDEERHTPAVRMIRALHAEGVLGGEQRAVYLARNDASESEKPAHGKLGTDSLSRFPSLCPEKYALFTEVSGLAAAR